MAQAARHLHRITEAGSSCSHLIRDFRNVQREFRHVRRQLRNAHGDHHNGHVMEDFREVKWAFQNLRQAVTAEDMVVVTVEDTAGDNELRFIRTYFEMTIRSFAERFSVKHPAVVKWEKKADLSTAMAWTTEKDIRLFIIDQLIKRPSELQKLYRVLEEEAKTSDRVIKIDSEQIAA